MKVIIQIPCYNEEQTLAVALADLPRTLPGVDVVEWMIINDGSTDRTVDVARQCGVDHIVDLPHNKGLAVGFMAGLERALALGADIIVNTDADNQYEARDIPALIAPILAGQAEIVIGTRPISQTEHFSPIKKMLQRFGSWVVRVASDTDVADAPSGFRAISREAALRLNVFTEFTYTLETIIQAGQRQMAVMCVPVRTNADLRPSRLVKSISDYVRRSIVTILHVFMVYRPFRFFLWLGLLPFSIGMILGARWLWLTYLMPDGRTRIPSLILASLLLLVGFQTWIFGFMAQLFSINRKLLEDLQLRARRQQLGSADTDRA